MNTDGPLRPVPGGVLLDVRLTPRGGRDGVDGILRLADGREVLAARVRAAPENGLANKALEQLVARWLGLSRAKVVVVSGHTARLKTLKIEADGGMIGEALSGLPQA